MRKVRRLPSESGTTLIEVLVAVVIMGTAVTSLLGGFTTAISGSVFHRVQAKTTTVLREYAESIENGGYLTCASPTPASFTEDGYVASVTGIQFWKGDSPTGTFAPCSPTDYSANGLGKVSIQTVSSDGKVTNTLDVFVRR